MLSLLPIRQSSGTFLMQNLHKFLEIFICAILRLSQTPECAHVAAGRYINLVGYYGFQYRSLIITHNPF